MGRAVRLHHRRRSGHRQQRRRERPAPRSHRPQELALLRLGSRRTHRRGSLHPHRHLPTTQGGTLHLPARRADPPRRQTDGSTRIIPPRPLAQPIELKDQRTIHRHPITRTQRASPDGYATLTGAARSRLAHPWARGLGCWRRRSRIVASWARGRTRCRPA